MFKSIKDLVAQAEDQGVALSDIMLTQEVEQTNCPREEVLQQMARNFQVMKAGALHGAGGVTSRSGMTGGDAKKLDIYIKAGQFLTDSTFLRALNYAIAINEVNASMGLICASPTAGSCGTLPGVMLAAQEKLQAADEQIVHCLFTAGAVGYVIANNAFISGAAGGCQAEVGVASAMAAAAVTQLAGGSPRQSAHAMAIALKNMLGLTCDPLAGLVEVPCIKRNAAGAANALAASEMALAGIESRVPWDEVIEAMYRIGQDMPQNVRETAQGGLAATQTGKRWKQLLWSMADEKAQKI